MVMAKNTFPLKDEELFTLMKRNLYTAVVGDILDRLGYTHQFLPPEIRPLHSEMKLAGRAMTVSMKQISRFPKNLFSKMIASLDDLKKNEVYIASGPTSYCANWGELMTTAAKARGAVGAVVSGYHRDTQGILALQSRPFPVFSRGAYAQDAAPRMEVSDFRVPIKFTGILHPNVKSFKPVTVQPGDIVFADLDGVLIIPQTIEKEVLTLALEKASGEKTVQKEIRSGKKVAEVFKRHGIL